MSSPPSRRNNSTLAAAPTSRCWPVALRPQLCAAAGWRRGRREQPARDAPALHAHWVVGVALTSCCWPVALRTRLCAAAGWRRGRPVQPAGGAPALLICSRVVWRSPHAAGRWHLPCVAAVFGVGADLALLPGGACRRRARAPTQRSGSGSRHHVLHAGGALALPMSCPACPARRQRGRRPSLASTCTQNTALSL